MLICLIPIVSVVIAIIAFFYILKDYKKQKEVIEIHNKMINETSNYLLPEINWILDYKMEGNNDFKFNENQL